MAPGTSSSVSSRRSVFMTSMRGKRFASPSWTEIARMGSVSYFNKRCRAAHERPSRRASGKSRRSPSSDYVLRNISLEPLHGVAPVLIHQAAAEVMGEKRGRLARKPHGFAHLCRLYRAGDRERRRGPPRTLATVTVTAGLGLSAVFQQERERRRGAGAAGYGGCSIKSPRSESPTGSTG